uniref:Uncharacterized protein n=1 Tax=Anguilla anguilla TaxID=7936 RepID=A0A0E9XE35_ANGAN
MHMYKCIYTYLNYWSSQLAVLKMVQRKCTLQTWQINSNITSIILVVTNTNIKYNIFKAIPGGTSP